MTLDTHVIIKADNLTWADDIAHMHSSCFPDCEVYGTDAPDSHWWVAYFGSQECPVAFAGLRLDHSTKQGYLCRSGVMQGHRGCGLQLKLIKTRIAYGKRAGLERLVTDTIPGNYHSANNLIRAGFVLYNPSTPWAGVEHSLYWRKEL